MVASGDSQEVSEQQQDTHSRCWVGYGLREGFIPTGRSSFPPGEVQPDGLGMAFPATLASVMTMLPDSMNRGWGDREQSLQWEGPQPRLELITTPPVH